MSKTRKSRNLLPPMSALRAFEATSRLGSFTLAAGELHVTQGAISRQVKLLEEFLDATLFERTSPRITLTDAGRFYAQHVAEGLGLIFSATRQAESYTRPQSELHIGIVPTFCSRWIIPRLSSFVEMHPRIQLHLTSVEAGRKVPLDCLDGALVVGREDAPNLIYHRLESEDLIAVANPKWIKKHGVKGPADLIGPPLLVHSARANLWARWFVLNGVDPGALVAAMLRLEQITMIIEASVAGLGAALLPRALIARELETRDLVAIKGNTMHVNDGFHFVYPKHKNSYAPLVAFRQWLLGLKPMRDATTGQRRRSALTFASKSEVERSLN